MNRTEKAESVASLKEVFKASKVVVVAHYSGLSVAQLQNLRKQMKQAGAQVKVAKNRLAKIALDGSDAASIAPLLKGPTLIAYSTAPGAVSLDTGNEAHSVYTKHLLAHLPVAGQTVEQLFKRVRMAVARETTVGVSQEEDTPPSGKADGDGASFIIRVIRIRVGERQRILEDGGGLVEGHTMSSQI